MKRIAFYEKIKKAGIYSTSVYRYRAVKKPVITIDGITMIETEIQRTRPYWTEWSTVFTFYDNVKEE